LPRIGVIGPWPLSLSIDLYYSEISQQNSTVFQIERKQCIPYKSDIPPYPYNNIDPANTSVFFGDHSCCLGNISNPDTWQLADNNTICYSRVGCSVNRYLMQEITQYCSGNRGNICDGNKIGVTRCCNANDCSDCQANPRCEKPFGPAVGGGYCYGTEGCEFIVPI
jgi:hypothetical protein